VCSGLKTAELKDEYAKRAGVEGTIGQSVRTCDVRRTRYIGQAKFHLQHLMTAAIMNVMHILCWLVGEPKAKTPRSAFAKLYQVAT
jgi:transposase